MGIYDLLAQDGLLSQNIPGYSERPQQLAMASLVEKCLDEGRVGIVEAGTGVGKSFAYLVPIIERGEGAIIATANKTLQAQLVGKDLPFLHRALGGGFTYAVAKGKENYVCLLSAKHAALSATWQDWITSTSTGDLDEAPMTPTAEEHRLLAAGDHCLQNRCPLRGECFYYHAKGEREHAQIVVTNHALLCAQAANRQIKILPDRPILVVDEAHQLEHYAIGSLAARVSAYSFRGPADIFAAEGRAFLDDLAEGRLSADRGDALIEPVLEYQQGIALVNALQDQAMSYAEQDAENNESSEKIMEARAARATLLSLAERVRQVASPTPPGWVRHVMASPYGPVAESTPFDVAALLSILPQIFHTAIYTSATLASNDLNHFKRRNGLLDVPAEELIVGSPFDYPRQALLYLPKHGKMPSPDWHNRDIFDAKARRATLRLVQASQGGALCLYTSHYAMREAAKYLAQETPYPVRAQGEMGKAALIQWLKTTPHAILCATASFWEGVDVPGDALRLVIMDKIPFAPQSPVQQARQAALGKRAFIDLSVPEAALSLKQGFGRLIRTATDRGVVAILDPRLWEKPYGRLIMASLPPAREVNLVEEVERFFGQETPVQEQGENGGALPYPLSWQEAASLVIEDALRAPRVSRTDPLWEAARIAQHQRDECRPADTHSRRRLFKTEDNDDDE